MNKLTRFFATLGAVAAVAFGISARDITFNGMKYTVINETARTCRVKAGDISNPGNKATGDIVIPAVVTEGDAEYQVIEIGSNAFRECSDMKSITLGANVATIGEYAFLHCFGLESVRIEGSIASIGKCAFDYCSALKSIDLSASSFTELPASVFASCEALETAVLPETLTSIGESAFEYCRALKSVNIPKSVTLFGDKALNTCASLQSIELPEGLKAIPYALLGGCSSLTSLKIPESVTTIGNSAFSRCTGLTSIVIPNNVTSVGRYAMSSNPNLKYVIFGKSVKSIGSDACNECPGLVKMALPNGPSSPANGSYSKIWYPPTDAVIENDFVYGADKVLYFAPITTDSHVTVPDFVEKIAGRAFLGCDALTTLTLGESLWAIESNAFEGCGNIASITCKSGTPATFEIDGTFVADVYGKASVVIPDGAIPAYAGSSWKTFSSMREESGLTGFAYTDDIFNYFLVPDGKYAILTGPVDANISVAAIPRRVAVEDANGDAAFYSVDQIAWYAFMKSWLLEKVSFPASVKTIGESAFFDCRRLREIEFAEGLERIGGYGFQKCEALTEIRLPDSLLEVGSHAFANCSAVTSITLGSSLEHLGDYCFGSVGSGKTVQISVFPASLKSIDNSFVFTVIDKVAITDLRAWMNVDMSGSSPNTYAAEKVIYLNGERMYHLVIPDGITEVKPYTFSNASVSTVSFPSSVKSIGACGFGFNYMQDVHIPPTVEYIGEYAFAYVDAVTIDDGTAPLFLEKNVFSNSMTEAYLGRNVNRLCPNSEYQFKKLTVGNLVTEIPDSLCATNYYLETLTLGSRVETIGKDAFSRSRIKEVVIPSSVRTIGENAFSSGELTTLAIGCGIESIGEKAFDGNDKLATVGITALASPSASNNSFSNYGAKLSVEAGSRNAYEDNPRCWYRFNNYGNLTRPESVSLNLERIEGRADDTFQLEAKAAPENVTLPYILWESSNPEVAVVDPNGKVTVTGVGGAKECEIKAYTLYSDSPSAVCRVNVAASGVEEAVAPASGGIDMNLPMEVYTLDGTFAATSCSGLPAGIYIVRQGDVTLKLVVK